MIAAATSRHGHSFIRCFVLKVSNAGFSISFLPFFCFPEALECQTHQFFVSILCRNPTAKVVGCPKKRYFWLEKCLKKNGQRKHMHQKRVTTKKKDDGGSISEGRGGA